MGIVVKQSFWNMFTTFIGFTIGAANTLFMYTHFLGKEFYGLTAFLLSSANLIMPLLSFGIQNTLVRFYNHSHTEKEQHQFLNFILLLPLVVILPFFAIGLFFYSELGILLSEENKIIKDYLWIIFAVGICMAYFEIFYAWVKIFFKSIYGNFLKEVGLRILISIFLFAVYFEFITKEIFIFSLVFIYGIITMLMAIAAFSIKKPSFSFGFPKKRKEIIQYSLFILFSSSVAILLLDIDKFMIGQFLPIEETAYYSVAIYIALSISVPMRAMHQITHPLTTQLMQKNKWVELQELYQKTAITLQVIGGWILVGILVNIKSIYALLPPEYEKGTTIVFLIGLSKYFDLMLGNNNSIIFNSKYYKTILMFGFCLIVVAVGLNYILIPLFKLDGVAMATLVAVVFYSLLKLFFVVRKMGLFPFTIKTLYSIMILIICFLLIYFLDFSIHPISSILIKSFLITLFYLGLHYKFKISVDINNQIDTILEKLKLLKI